MRTPNRRAQVGQAAEPRGAPFGCRGQGRNFAKQGRVRAADGPKKPGSSSPAAHKTTRVATLSAEPFNRRGAARRSKVHPASRKRPCCKWYPVDSKHGRRQHISQQDARWSYMGAQCRVEHASCGYDHVFSCVPGLDMLCQIRIGVHMQSA